MACLNCYCDTHKKVSQLEGLSVTQWALSLPHFMGKQSNFLKVKIINRNYP